jgi:tricarballylate dehydrogenase
LTAAVEAAESTAERRPRILVVGAGASGLVAAIAATDDGADVEILESGGPDDVGGNARLSGGLFLFSHDGSADVLPLVDPSLVDHPFVDLDKGAVDVEPYSAEEYLATLTTMSDGRADRELARALIADSLDGMRWLAEIGVRFQLTSAVFGSFRQAGRIVVPPGPALETGGAGGGLVHALVDAVDRRGLSIRYGSSLVDLVVDGDVVAGVRLANGEEITGFDSVILTAGGFEASPRMRRQFLGPEWEHVTVRGTRHNTGEPMESARRLGAAVHGDLATCHSISVDAGAPSVPPPGGPTAARLSRGFRYGIMVNAHGERFFDEGEDLWTRIYSKMGRAILRQPGAVAFHVFDAKVAERARSAMPGVEPIVADTLDIAAARAGIDGAALRRTISEFNDAVIDRPLDFDRLDSRGTAGIDPPKSNWALAIDTPPYTVYPAACGITFTHGGLHIDAYARVLRTDGSPMRGLYAAGEITGGFFFGNYPGGSSLMRSVVFGRRAVAAALDDQAGCPR